MSNDMEKTLRDSLDAVDRDRQIAILVGIPVFLAVCLALAALFQEAAAAASHPGFLKALYVASTVQMLFMAACTAFVTFRVSRTTKAILRMIDLSRSRESKSN
jgi:hypothetical protein